MFKKGNVMEDYKQEIVNTRKGCVGSSDAKTLAQIANLGYVPKTAYKRLAIVKGLIEQEDGVYTKEMAFGDFVEQQLYNHLKSQDERYESNPLWVSKKYSRPNVKCISHPDIVLKDEVKKVLYVYEVKASKAQTKDVRSTYVAQLFHHNLLAKEKASEFGRDWKVRVRLVHYNTDGINLEDGFTFDIERVTIKECKFNASCFDLSKAMDCVNDFLTTFDSYYSDEEVDASLLPTHVQETLDTISNILLEIKEREQKVNDFKERLYKFLEEKQIKSIKSDFFTISRVDPTESVSFDYKKFLEDYERNHPYAAKKLKAKYERRTFRKGYATFKLKN